MAIHRWISQIIAPSRNASSTPEALCQDIIFDVLCSLVRDFNSGIDQELQIITMPPSSSTAGHRKAACRRAAIIGDRYVLSISARKGEVSLFLTPSTDMNSIGEETESSKILALKTDFRNERELWMQLDGSSNLLSRADLNALLLACFNDFLKRSSPPAPPKIRLVAGEQSLITTFKRLVSENHRLTLELIEQNELIRNQIMMEIHDDVLSDLIYARQLADEYGDQQLSELISNATIRLRQLINTEFTERDLVDWGLEVALQELVSNWSKLTPAKIVTNGESIRKLPSAVTLHTFRIVQESLKNAIKHAEAGQITITLRQENKYLEIEVCDDGKGIQEPEEGTARSFGLAIMQERLSLLNKHLPAELTIDSGSNRGTSIALRLYDRTGSGDNKHALPSWKP